MTDSPVRLSDVKRTINTPQEKAMANGFDKTALCNPKIAIAERLGVMLARTDAAHLEDLGLDRPKANALALACLLYTIDDTDMPLDAVQCAVVLLPALARLGFTDDVVRIGILLSLFAETTRSYPASFNHPTWTMALATAGQALQNLASLGKDGNDAQLLERADLAAGWLKTHYGHLWS